MSTSLDLEYSYPVHTMVEVVEISNDSQPRDLFGEIIDPVKSGTVGFVDYIGPGGQLCIILKSGRKVLLIPSKDKVKLFAEYVTFEKAIQAFGSGKTITMEFVDNGKWYAAMAFKKGSYDSTDMLPPFSEWKNGRFYIHQEA